MIAIVASNRDPIAQSCVSRWASEDVGILTVPDLSTLGWRQQPSRSDRDTVVIKGNLVPQGEITGVLTLLPYVAENELVDIVPKDRPYVAAEMNAFLLYWLSKIRCPVLNRPTPLCLSGPHWRREAWVNAAARAGIPVEAFRRRAAPESSAGDETVEGAAVVTVAGKSVIGDTDPELHIHARRLAALAGVELLAVCFSSPEPDALFITASTFTNLSDDRIAGAVLDYLRPASCA